MSFEWGVNGGTQKTKWGFWLRVGKFIAESEKFWTLKKKYQWAKWLVIKHEQAVIFETNFAMCVWCNSDLVETHREISVVMSSYGPPRLTIIAYWENNALRWTTLIGQPDFFQRPTQVITYIDMMYVHIHDKSCLFGIMLLIALLLYTVFVEAAKCVTHVVSTNADWWEQHWVKCWLVVRFSTGPYHGDRWIWKTCLHVALANESTRLECSHSVGSINCKHSANHTLVWANHMACQTSGHPHGTQLSDVCNLAHVVKPYSSHTYQNPTRFNPYTYQSRCWFVRT